MAEGILSIVFVIIKTWSMLLHRCGHWHVNYIDKQRIFVDLSVFLWKIPYY